MSGSLRCGLPRSPPASRRRPCTRLLAPGDRVIARLLGRLDWTELLGTAGWTGWRFEQAGDLHCPDDRPLSLTTVRKADHAEGHTGIIFRRPKGGSENYAPRPYCLKSERAEALKHPELSIPTEVAEPLRERMARFRRGGRAPTKPVQPRAQEVTDPLFLPARPDRPPMSASAGHRCGLRSSALTIHPGLSCARRTLGNVSADGRPGRKSLPSTPFPRTLRCASGWRRAPPFAPHFDWTPGL